MTEPILEAKTIHKSFGKVDAVRGLDLALWSGEIYGLVGPDGAGKTTMIRMLAGLMAPQAGQVRVGGHDPLKNRGALRDMLGYMPQQYSLYGDLTVAENLRFFADLFCLDRATFEQRRHRLMELTRLARFQDRRADALSGGMYKKLALSTALLHRPALLLLDEPTNGVDPVSRRELWDLLSEFAREGMAVLISTPYMDEASRCHRVGLIHQGRLLLEGPPSDLLGQFPYRVFRIVGGERSAILAALSDLPGVLAVSPSGARVRAVVDRGAEPDVALALRAIGAEPLAAAPDFEDLFLACLRHQGAA